MAGHHTFTSTKFFGAEMEGQGEFDFEVTVPNTGSFEWTLRTEHDENAYKNWDYLWADIEMEVEEQVGGRWEDELDSGYGGHNPGFGDGFEVTLELTEEAAKEHGVEEEYAWVDWSASSSSPWYSAEDEYGAETSEVQYPHQVFNSTSKAHAEKVASLVPDSIVKGDSGHPLNWFVLSKTSYSEARPYYTPWLRENDYFRSNQFLSEVKYEAESFSAENAEGERDFFKESGGECEWCKGVVREEDGTATGDAWFCNACIGYTHPSKVRYLKGQPQEGWGAESFSAENWKEYVQEDGKLYVIPKWGSWSINTKEHLGYGSGGRRWVCKDVIPDTDYGISGYQWPSDRSCKRCLKWSEHNDYHLITMKDDEDVWEYYHYDKKGLRAESFSAELKRDSCCCGATKSKPCACMIEGVMECNATCPCSLEKGAESFSADVSPQNSIDWEKVAAEEWRAGYPHTVSLLTYQNKQANKSLLSCLNAHLKIAKDEVSMGHYQYPDLADETITYEYEEKYGRKPTREEIDKALPPLIKGLRKQAKKGIYDGETWEELSEALKSPLSRFRWGRGDYTGRKGWFDVGEQNWSAESFSAEHFDDVSPLDGPCKHCGHDMFTESHKSWFCDRKSGGCGIVAHFVNPFGAESCDDLCTQCEWCDTCIDGVCENVEEEWGREWADFDHLCRRCHDKHIEELGMFAESFSAERDFACADCGEVIIDDDYEVSDEGATLCGGQFGNNCADAESFHSYKVAPDLSSYTKAELLSSIAGPQGTAAYQEVVYDPIAQSRLSAEGVSSFSPTRLMVLGASIGVALGLYTTRGD